MTPRTQLLRDWLRREVRQRPSALDPADMGTSFGLEMTLEAGRTEPPPAANFSQPGSPYRVARDPNGA
jgi:hypothetical protein